MSSMASQVDSDEPVPLETDFPGLTTEPPPSPSSQCAMELDSNDDDEAEGAPLESIYSSLSGLLSSGKYSDMTIHCGGREFKAHRAVVCSQSRFFDAAFGNDFKEAVSQSIDLPDDLPDILGLFLEFLYTGNYTDGVIPTRGLPSNAATMTPDEVQEALETPVGVDCNQVTSVEDERRYRPSRGEYPTPSREPKEEFEEFNDDSSETSEDSNERMVWGRQHDPITVIDMGYPGNEEITQNSLYKSALACKRNDLSLHLRLYIMADKFDVPTLKLLTRDRFYRAAEVVWVEDECFPDVIDELYSRTREEDTALRDIVCRLVANQIQDEAIRTRMKPVLSKHGDFATGILECMINTKQVTWR